MTQEPWKRAAQLSKLQRRNPAGRRDRPERIPPKFNCGTVLLIGVLILLVVGGTAAWLTRDWWIPRYRDSLPPAISDKIEEPRVYPDFLMLEQGMGAGLVMFGSYLDLIAGTREWRDDWRIIQTGPETLRMENSGIKVYVKNGEIENFNIDLEQLMSDELWKGWQPAWREANLTPDLTWTAYTGSAEMPGGLAEDTYVSQHPIPRGANYVRAAWVLQFHNGWLSRIESRIEFGATTGDG